MPTVTRKPFGWFLSILDLGCKTCNLLLREDVSWYMNVQIFITFCVNRSQGEVHNVYGCLCVCLSVHHIPTLLHRSGCNLGGMVGGAL